MMYDDWALALGGENVLNQTEVFAHELVEEVPRLRPVLESHEAEFAELLPHVFMGAVSRFASEAHDRCTSGVAGACSELDALLAALEHAFVDGGEDVQELIVVSFLENVAEDVVASREFESRLGPVLRREIQVYLDAYGSRE